MDETGAGSSERGIKVVTFHGSDDDNAESLVKSSKEYAPVPPHDLSQSHESDSICATNSKDPREDSKDDVNLQEGSREDSEDDVNLQEDSVDDVNFQEDAFTILFVSPVCSTSFFYALFFFLMQMAILVLSSVNLLNDSDPGNPLKVPVANLTGVKFAQALALFATVVSSTDVAESLNVFHLQFDPSILDIFPSATRTRWYILNLLRFMLGFMCMVVAFLFIVQSTDVLGLFLDFAAVQFVSELDDLGFYLADNGYSILRMKHLTTEIKSLSFREKKIDPSSCFSRAVIQNSFSVVILLVLLSVWVTVTIMQDVGYYFDLNCQHFEVNLDSMTYHYFHDHSDAINYTAFPSWEHRETPIHYSSFSDTYVAGRKDDKSLVMRNKRPVYYHIGKVGKDGLSKYPPRENIYCEEEEDQIV